MSVVTRYRREVVGVLVYFLQVLLATAFIIVFVGRVSVVQGSSMEPSIVPGERILVNLLVYDFYQPQRNDVIVFRSPRDITKDYIKRVIAVPGDTLEIRMGETWLNGHAVAERYVTMCDYGDYPLVRLKPGEVFVMGDNRSNSEDSRRWGPLPLRLVRGKASVVFWPPGRAAVLR